MEWQEWKPWYDEISMDLGIDQAADMESARLLGKLIEKRSAELDVLANLIGGKDVAIVGPAPILRMDFLDTVIVSAGSAAEQLLLKGIMPHILVTDLDGNVRAQVKACDSGAVAVLHAHGDNMAALREWVPRFRRPFIGTTQAKPFGALHNYGGFTDGDRAVFLAIHFKARRISLHGFDFDNPVGKPGLDLRLKKRKLYHARRLIDFAREHYGIEIAMEVEPGKV